MGNRAVITTAPYKPGNIGIYVHWNGGKASIEGFLKAARELDYRTPGADPSYAMGGLVGLIYTYLGTDGLSVGIDRCNRLDTGNYDNGTYLIGPGWEIVGRQFANEWSDEVDQTKTDAIAALIVAKVKAADATTSLPTNHQSEA